MSMVTFQNLAAWSLEGCPTGAVLVSRGWALLSSWSLLLMGGLLGGGAFLLFFWCETSQM